MRAAPLPLPSSDRRKDTLHFGDSSFTVWCMILEKLKRQEKRRVGRRRWEETIKRVHRCEGSAQNGGRERRFKVNPITTILSGESRNQLLCTAYKGRGMNKTQTHPSSKPGAPRGPHTKRGARAWAWTTEAGPGWASSADGMGTNGSCSPLRPPAHHHVQHLKPRTEGPPSEGQSLHEQ